FAVLTVGCVVALLALTWNLRPPGRGVGLVLGWALVHVVMVGHFARPAMPLWQLLAVFVPSTVWVVWLAWLGAWPLRWPVRLGLLGLWLGLAALAPAVIRVEGMTGDTTNATPTLVFAWRTAAPTFAAPVPAARADVAPTPDDFPRFL